LEDSTFTSKDVIVLSRDMIFVKAEAKNDTLTADQYKIVGFPTIILMNSSGEEIDRIYGYLPHAEFVSTIQSYLQGKETLEDLKNRFQADSTDEELAYKLAEKYEGRRGYDEAASYYQKVVNLDPENKNGKSQDALFNLAWLELRKQDYLKAVDAFKNFLEKYPKGEDAEVAERLIPYSYAKAGDTTQALELYQKFLTDHPDSKDTSWVKDKIKELKKEGATEQDQSTD
jgi:tetratricopeptide (TPR) repeat protein